MSGNIRMPKLKDINSGLILFFNYLYSDETNNDGMNNLNVKEIMKITDRYKLDSLKNTCLFWLC